MATPLETIDRELAKAATALRKAHTDLDFGRMLTLWDDVDDLLDRRLSIRSASV